MLHGTIVNFYANILNTYALNSSYKMISKRKKIKFVIEFIEY